MLSPRQSMLCPSRSLTGASVQSIEADGGRRTQADIASLFRDNAGKFFQSRFPTFHLRTIEMDGKQVDVLIIEDEPKKPYYLVERIKNVRAHHIYTRVCDTNTPIDRVAQPHEIERMWRERFGLDAPALERAKRCLAEPSVWTLRHEDGFVCCHHDVFPEFTLKAASAEGDHLDSGQEWTRGEIPNRQQSRRLVRTPLPPDRVETHPLCELRRPQEEHGRSRLGAGRAGALLLLQGRQHSLLGPAVLDRAR